MHDPMNDLHRRLCRVEDELRDLRARERRWRARSRGSAAVAVAALGAALWTAGPRPGQAQVRSEGFLEGTAGARVRAPFTVVGRHGRVLLRVSETAKGSLLVFNDPFGKRVADLNGGLDARGLDLFDPQGRIVMGAGTFDTATSHYRSIDLFDAAGNNLMDLGLESPSPGAGVHVHNLAGRTVANLVAADAGTGQLTLSDAAGNVLFEEP